MIDTRVAREFVVVDDPRVRQCHASTLLVADGRITVAWFGGTAEGTQDNAVWMAHRAADGSWTAPAVADGDGVIARWNPVLSPAPGGGFRLFLKRGHRISEWTTWVMRSDDGLAWSRAEPVRADAADAGPVKNPPLAWDGLWLAPASVETAPPAPRWDAHVDVSSDGGATWRRWPVPFDHGSARGPGLIQPSLWPSPHGVTLLARSTEGFAYRSHSQDGRHWAPARPTQLPNNNSGLCATALPGGRVVCAHNPVSGQWAPRCPLVLSVSDDDGRTWRQRVVLDDGETLLEGRPARRPSREGTIEGRDDGVITDGVGEYSYPTLVVAGDEVLVTYTWQRRGIVLARVPLEAVSG